MEFQQEDQKSPTSTTTPKESAFTAPGLKASPQKKLIPKPPPKSKQQLFMQTNMPDILRKKLVAMHSSLASSDNLLVHTEKTAGNIDKTPHHPQQTSSTRKTLARARLAAGNFRLEAGAGAGTGASFRETCMRPIPTNPAQTARTEEITTRQAEGDTKLGAGPGTFFKNIKHSRARPSSAGRARPSSAGRATPSPAGRATPSSAGKGTGVRTPTSPTEAKHSNCKSPLATNARRLTSSPSSPLSDGSPTCVAELLAPAT